MAGRKMSLESAVKQVAAQQAVVDNYQSKLDKAKEELQKRKDKLEEVKRDIVMSAVTDSNLSYEEAASILKANAKEKPQKAKKPSKSKSKAKQQSDAEPPKE